MSLVWEMELPDSEKIVLLALADCANDEGHCWPGMRSLTKKCCKSDRTVQLAIKMLVAKGHLTRREVPGKGCNYTVHPIVRLGNGERHYLYRTEDAETGEFYIGARSCFGDPEADDYLGSGEWVKRALDDGRRLTKTVIETFPSREALAVAEQTATAAVFGQKLCRNRKIATPETLSPRNRLAPKPATPTPEAASGKPLGTINTEAKASYTAVIDLWNELSPTSGIPTVRVLNNSRKQMLTARIKEHGLETMLEAVRRVHGSPFCRGGEGARRKADIMYILQPKTLARTLEGYYGGANSNKITDPAVIAANKRAAADIYDKMGRSDEASALRREAAALIEKCAIARAA